MIVAILLDDICVTHMDVIRTTAGGYSFVVGDSTVYLADSVEGILKCGHVSNLPTLLVACISCSTSLFFVVDTPQDKHSGVEPNIAAILTIDDEFNVTEYVRQRVTPHHNVVFEWHR